MKYKTGRILKIICWYKCRDFHFETHESVTSGGSLAWHAFVTLSVIINSLTIAARKRKLQRMKLALEDIQYQKREKIV